MAKNKYSRDYRLIEDFRADGKIRTDYEYIGDKWVFKHDEAFVRGESRKALGLIIFAAAGFITALIPATGMMHRLWIALPFGFTALPLFLALETILAVRRMKVPMEHRFADKANMNYPARTLALLYMSAVSGAAEIIYLIMNGVGTAGDIVMTACTAVIIICAGLLFKRRKSFEAVTTQDPSRDP